jgi:hypothetical protein
MHANATDDESSAASTTVPTDAGSKFSSSTVPVSPSSLHSSIVMLNIQSMNPSASSTARWKVHNLKSIVSAELQKDHCIPFIALTETWLKSYHADAQLHIPGYVVSRCDRENRVGGGVLLYSHANIPLSDYEVHDDKVCQAVFCRFETIKTCITVLYRPPNASSSSSTALFDFVKKQINQLNDENYQLCIMGDFNLPRIDWNSGTTDSGGSSDENIAGEALLSFMSNCFLNQYVVSPTRGDNILDIFLCNEDRLVTNVSCSPTDMSDHSLVDIMISYNPANADDTKHSKTFDENSFRSLDFSNANFEEISEKLRLVDWTNLRSVCTFEEFPAVFTEKLFEICHSTVPPKKRSSTGRPKALNALRRRKGRLKSRMTALISKNGDPQHIQSVKNQLALICYDMKEAINKSLDLQEQKAVQKVKTNPKFFYSYAKSFSRIKSSISMLFNNDDQIVTDKTKMADLLQDQFTSVFSDPNSPHVQSPEFPPSEIEQPFKEEDFTISYEDIIAAISEIRSDSASGPDGVPAILLKKCAAELCEPLSLLWSESFLTGVVPAYYKKSFVSPLYKKGDRAKAANYRPVSLTSHVIKVYERVVRKTIVSYLDKNNILCHNQHGFRSGRSCLTQLLGHFDDIMLGLTEGIDTDAIYLDYAKAFDKVDHKLLLSKLQRYGFDNKLIKWIESFLSDRQQTVVLDGHHSYITTILSGVPQGTVLGPILFILFINDMELCVKHSTVRFFADDTRISKHIKSEASVVELQEDLNSVISWASKNNMMLHEDKFELMIHKHRPNFELYELPFVSQLMTYSVSTGETLHPVHVLRDLGVIVSSDLKWTYHISTIVSRARTVASWVLSVFKTRDKLTMLTLYKSLVRSHLEYCCPLWNPSSPSDIKLLENVQRTFTSKIWGIQHLDYWDRLKALGLMSLQRRRERYTIIQVWKIHHDLTPNDLNIMFSASSRHGVKAKVPCLSKTSSMRHQTLYDSSFAVHGPRLWNALPDHLRKIAVADQFKHKLTEFLLTIPDKPPVSGYCCANGNSILHWFENKAEAQLLGRSDNLMTL